MSTNVEKWSRVNAEKLTTLSVQGPRRADPNFIGFPDVRPRGAGRPEGEAMIRQEVWMDVKLLHRQGASIRRIARTTGLSRQSVRRILMQKAPKPYGPRRSQPSILDPFIARLEELITARPLARATVLFETIAREGYPGHYERVKVWVRARRREETARRRACVRFETAPALRRNSTGKDRSRVCWISIRASRCTSSVSYLHGRGRAGRWSY